MHPFSIDDLQGSLRRLDAILQGAIDIAEALYGDAASAMANHGLYISPEEVTRSLKREPGTPLLWAEPENVGRSPLQWLTTDFDLTDFDLDILLIALAPDIDLRYERLYAYLQDDVTRKRPTVDLVLNLLCPDVGAKILRRQHFAPNAPLMQHHLVHLVADPNQVHPPLLAHNLKLDEQLVRVLLGGDSVDSRIQPVAELVLAPESSTSSPPTLKLVDAIVQSLEGVAAKRVYLSGSEDLCCEVGLGIAAAQQLRLLRVNLAQTLELKLDWQQTLRLALREALFQPALLYLEGLDAVSIEAFPGQQLIQMLATARMSVVLSGRALWQPVATGRLEAIRVELPRPDVGQRHTYWQAALQKAGITLPKAELSALAGRFQLTPSQIRHATAATQHQLNGAVSSQSGVSLQQLYAAARAQTGHGLAALTRKLSTYYTWDDLVLPLAQVELLKELCNQFRFRYQVYDQWGFGQKYSLGKGLNVLFSGPPGTGKTMAAEVVAHDLQLDLYKIDLSQIVSKYIGETEKNLDRIFNAAESANAILLFDEADALFGKRSDVRDAHDRYANIEVGYLLQKMEEYEGIAILTTNLQSNMDDAFIRRLRFIVTFSLPDAESRLQIWRGIFPGAAQISPEVDFSTLATNFEITGANIRNIALAAAFLAASAEQPISMEHIVFALRREYEKTGKMLKGKDLKQLANPHNI